MEEKGYAKSVIVWAGIVSKNKNKWYNDLILKAWIDGRNANRANVPGREWGVVGRGDGG